MFGLAFLHFFVVNLWSRKGITVPHTIFRTIQQIHLNPETWTFLGTLICLGWINRLLYFFPLLALRYIFSAGHYFYISGNRVGIQLIFSESFWPPLNGALLFPVQMTTKLWDLWLMDIVRATSLKCIFLKMCSILFQPRSLLAHSKPFSRTKTRFLFCFFKKLLYPSISFKKKLKEEIFDCAAQYLSSWTRGWTHASCSGSVESKLLEHGGVPKRTIFNVYIHTLKLAGSEDYLMLIFLNTRISLCHIIS